MTSLKWPIITLFIFTALAAPQLVSATDTTEIIKLREDISVPTGTTVDRAITLLGSITVDGAVKESAISVLGNVTLGPGAKVGEDAVAIGGKVIRGEGSVVEGREMSLDLNLQYVEKFLFLAVPVVASIVAGAVGIATIFSGIGFVALVVLVLTLFEKNVLKAQKYLTDYPLRSVLLGLAGFCALVPILIFLIVTVLGIPLAFLGAAVAVAAIVLGSVAVGNWIGMTIAIRLKWKLKTVWSGLLGTVALLLIGLIPVVGTLVQFCVLFFGLGAVLQSKFQS